MRRLITIDFDQLVYRLLPDHKRLPKRLMLFRWPLMQLTSLFNDFKIWRADVFYRVNVTGQTLSLQAYLNRAVTGANNQILVQGYNDAGIWVQLSTADGEAYMIPAGLSNEATSVSVALEGEITPLNDVDFYVHVPSTVLVGDVARIVNNYKLAGKRYQIIQV
jgi:hypothetical protein